MNSHVYRMYPTIDNILSPLRSGKGRVYYLWSKIVGMIPAVITHDVICFLVAILVLSLSIMDPPGFDGMYVCTGM